jgi:hypothetical protein
MQAVTDCTSIVTAAAGGSCAAPSPRSVLPRRQRFAALLFYSILSRPHQTGLFDLSCDERPVMPTIMYKDS